VADGAGVDALADVAGAGSITSGGAPAQAASKRLATVIPQKRRLAIIGIGPP